MSWVHRLARSCASVRVERFAIFLATACLGIGGTLDDNQVDRAIVFRAGPLEVSRYQYLKNENRFEQKVSEEEGRAPTETERRAWCELFSARNIIIARAQLQGYSDRPEIRNLVSSMEEYMLTQTEGPFYLSLYKKVPTTPEDIEALYRLNDRRVDGIALRFDREVDAQLVLGADFPACTRKEKITRLKRGLANPRAVYWQGSMIWPYEPFSESGQRIHGLDTNGSIEHEQTEQGILYFFAGSVETIAHHLLDDRRDAFRAFVTEFNKHRIQQSRRAFVVSETRFDWDASAAEKWLLCIRANLTNEARIDDNALSQAGTLVLATYTFHDQTVRVTNQDWHRWFNRRFIRAIPQSTREMGESLIAMAVERVDLYDARAQGLDRSPKFVEDRQNFLNYQVLDAYEREHIRPGINVSDVEIANEFASHPSTFQRIAWVHAHQLVFANEATASAYLLNNAAGTQKNKSSAPQPLREADLVVRRPAGRESQPGFETVFIASAPGTVFGPEVRPDGAVLFVRGKDGDPEAIPLAEVRGAIRLRLEQQRVDQRERELARQLSQQIPVRDDLPLERDTLAMNRSLGGSR